MKQKELQEKAETGEDSGKAHDQGGGSVFRQVVVNVGCGQKYLIDAEQLQQDPQEEEDRLRDRDREGPEKTCGGTQYQQQGHVQFQQGQIVPGHLPKGLPVGDQIDKTGHGQDGAPHFQGRPKQ